MGKWRFWGIVLIGVALFSLIVFPEHRSTDPASLMLPLLTAATGTVLLVTAGKGSIEPVALAHIDSKAGTLEVFARASTLLEGENREVWIDEIHDVLFGMTLWPSGKETRIKSRAFSVCVRLYNGNIIPIIEATTREEAAFRIARTLSEVAEVPVHQTGMGV